MLDVPHRLNVAEKPRACGLDVLKAGLQIAVEVRGTGRGAGGHDPAFSLR